MSDYPTLKEMGIRSLDELSHFTVRHEHRTDVLKVYYRRAKGSLLPRSKKFTFVRPADAVLNHYRGLNGWDQLKQSSPRLHAAILELEQLTQPQQPVVTDQKAQFLSDLDHLEKVMQAKIDELRRQVEAMD
ncbi:MAG TPA: DUF3461 family protein [Motiliproteus sp.]